MRDLLFDAHSGWQYVTLLAVVGTLVLSLLRSVEFSRKETWYRMLPVAVDIQVALGLVLWVVSSGWELGLMQGWVHPLVGLAAVGAFHAFTKRALAAKGGEGDRIMRTGSLIALILVVVAIAVAEMA